MSGQAAPERYCKGGCGRLIPYAGMGRPRVWCAFCSKDETRKTDKRKAPRRFVTDDFGTTRCYKRCTACTAWKVQSLDNFTVRRRDRETGRVMEWQAECRPCINERRRREWANRDPEFKRERTLRQYHAMMADDARREREREQARKRERRRRANMTAEQRERYNAKKRAAYARQMAKVGTRAARAEGRRLLARMRATEDGRDIAARKAMNGFTERNGKGDVRLSVWPVFAWAHSVLEREVPDLGRPHGVCAASRDDRSRTVADLAAELGVSDRQLLRMRHAEDPHVTLGVADRMLVRYGRPITIDGELVGREMAAYCRSMPGNGERILRYIDLAERIGHLDGAVVERVEDLWRELA